MFFYKIFKSHIKSALGLHYSYQSICVIFFPHSGFRVTTPKRRISSLVFACCVLANVTDKHHSIRKMCAQFLNRENTCPKLTGVSHGTSRAFQMSFKLLFLLHCPLNCHWQSNQLHLTLHRWN